jgi:cobalamin biosynthesis protein CobD/CbiB
MNPARSVFAALVLDAWLGETHRLHLPVGSGRVAQTLERHLHADSILCGVLAAVLLRAPFSMLTLLIDRVPDHETAWTRPEVVLTSLTAMHPAETVA